MQDTLPLKTEQNRLQENTIQDNSKFKMGNKMPANWNCEDGARKNILSHPLDSFEAMSRDLPGEEFCELIFRTMIIQLYSSGA